MKKVISQITEAFSMQPRTFSIKKGLSDFRTSPEDYVSKIVIENIAVGCENGQPIEKLCYVGYDFNGNQKFIYMAETVNVVYDYLDID